MKPLAFIAALVPTVAIALGQSSTVTWNFPPSLLTNYNAISFNVRAIRVAEFSPTNSWTNWIIATNTVATSCRVPWGQGAYLQVSVTNRLTGVESLVGECCPCRRTIE